MGIEQRTSVVVFGAELSIDAYSDRDGDQRFWRSLGWLVDGLFEEMLS